jgi:hypothetical protein
MNDLQKSLGLPALVALGAAAYSVPVGSTRTGIFSPNTAQVVRSSASRSARCSRRSSPSPTRSWPPPSSGPAVRSSSATWPLTVPLAFLPDG